LLSALIADRSAILLNRCITCAHSISDARQAVQNLGF
jgi:hypothetical protein